MISKPFTPGCLFRQFGDSRGASPAGPWPVARHHVSVGVLRWFRSQQSSEGVENAPDEREARILFLHLPILHLFHAVCRDVERERPSLH
jgi:hypothetical protein